MSMRLIARRATPRWPLVIVRAYRSSHIGGRLLGLATDGRIGDRRDDPCHRRASTQTVRDALGAVRCRRTDDGEVA